MPGRIALAVCSLGIAAVLAVQLHAHERLAAGQEPAFLAGERALPPAERKQVLADLRAAERFRPGTAALLPAAIVHLRAGNRRAAERLARRAVDREPRNAVAWRVLATILARSDAAAARRASATARRLDPLTSSRRESRSSR